MWADQTSTSKTSYFQSGLCLKNRSILADSALSPNPKSNYEKTISKALSIAIKKSIPHANDSLPQIPDPTRNPEILVYQYLSVEEQYKQNWFSKYYLNLVSVEKYCEKWNYTYVLDWVDHDVLSDVLLKHRKDYSSRTNHHFFPAKIFKIWLVERTLLQYNPKWLLVLDVDMAIPPETIFNRPIQSIIDTAYKNYGMKEDDIVFIAQDTGYSVNGGFWLFHNERQSFATRLSTLEHAPSRHKAIAGAGLHTFDNNKTSTSISNATDDISINGTDSKTLQSSTPLFEKIDFLDHYETQTAKNKSDVIEQHIHVNLDAAVTGPSLSPRIQFMFDLLKAYFHQPFNNNDHGLRQITDQYGMMQVILTIAAKYRSKPYNASCLNENFNSCWGQVMTYELGFPVNQRQFDGICLFGYDHKETRLNMHDNGKKYQKGDFLFHGKGRPKFLKHKIYHT